MSFADAIEHFRTFQHRVKELAREKQELEKTRAEQAQIAQEQAVKALSLLRQAARLEQQRQEQEKVAERQAAVEARQRATDQRQAKTEAKQRRTAAIQCGPKWVLNAIFVGLPPVISAKHSFGVTLENTMAAIKITSTLASIGKACPVESKGLLLSSFSETADTLASVSSDDIVPAVVEVQPSTAIPTQTKPAVNCTWLKKTWKRASKFCELIGANVQAIGKKRETRSTYNVVATSQSRASLRELTVEEAAAWDAFMALSNSLNSDVLSRLDRDMADIFELVQPDVLTEFDSCINFLMAQSNKEFTSGKFWFRVPPTPAELALITSLGFDAYMEDATKRGQVVPPNLVAGYLKRVLLKVHDGVVTPTMQAFIAEIQQTPDSTESIVRLLKLNTGRHHIVTAMSRLACKILQGDVALSTELAAVMHITNVNLSDAHTAFMAKPSAKARGAAELNDMNAAALKEFNDGMRKWNEVVAWIYLNPETFA
ncbi:hypothetical protein HDU78_006000 [Chytriomyces hyalinus]|nr:hypothetical protein HDU78_006000 [Chytriomyces hyalinus]